MVIILRKYTGSIGGNYVYYEGLNVMKMISLFSVILALVIVPASYAEGLQKVEIDGNEVLYVTKGKGDIPIIMESGLGNGIESWVPIFEDLADETLAFVYARPGYNGRSDDRNPKTASFVVANLRKTLKKLNINGPYILVGHSLGGMYMEYFAKNFPEDVAALVLVDSRHRSFSKACMADFGPEKCLPPKEAFEKFPEFMKSEFNALPAIESELDGSPQFGDYPIYMFTGAKGMDPKQKKLNKLWVKTQKKFAAEKDTIVHKISKKSGHYVHHQDPKIVIKAIKKALKKAESSK